MDGQADGQVDAGACKEQMGGQIDTHTERDRQTQMDGQADRDAYRNIYIKTF